MNLNFMSQKVDMGDFTISKHPRYTKPRIYPKGKESHSFKPELEKHKGIMVECACGCKELIPKYDDRNVEHRFKEGHHLNWLHNKIRGKPQRRRVQDQDLKTNRERRVRAQWYIKHEYHTEPKCVVFDRQICLGKLGVFFIDGNDLNFSKENIGFMCRGHRQLMVANHYDLEDLRDLKAHFYWVSPEYRSKQPKRRWCVPNYSRHK